MDVLLYNPIEEVSAMPGLSNAEILAILEGYPHEVFYIASKPIIHSGIYNQVNRAGIMLNTPANFHITRNASYRYSVIHCAFRGKGYVISRGKQHVVEAGSCFLLAAQEPHEYWTDPGDPWELAWIEFGGGMSAQLARHVLDRGGPVFSGSAFSRELELCTSILAREDMQEPKISAILYEMLMCLCAEVEASTEPDSTMRNVLSYISDNLGQSLTLERLAGVFGYNPSYFSAMFSKSVGIGLSKYVQLQRINRACILLITTQWPLESIAGELGYYDTSHFIHAFKTVEGITPSAYRRENRFTKRDGVRVRG